MALQYTILYTSPGQRPSHLLHPIPSDSPYSLTVEFNLALGAMGDSNSVEITILAGLFTLNMGLGGVRAMAFPGRTRIRNGLVY